MLYSYFLTDYFLPAFNNTLNACVEAHFQMSLLILVDPDYTFNMFPNLDLNHLRCFVWC